MANGLLTLIFLFVLIPLYFIVSWSIGGAIRGIALSRGMVPTQFQAWTPVVVFAAPFVLLGTVWFAFEHAADRERALESAARDGNVAKVGRLLGRGVPIDGRFSDTTPIAAAINWREWEMVRFLIRRGAHDRPMNLEEEDSPRLASQELDDEGQKELARLLRANGPG